MKTAHPLPALVGYNPKRHMRIPFGYLEWNEYQGQYICRNAQGSNLGNIKTYQAAVAHVAERHNKL